MTLTIFGEDGRRSLTDWLYWIGSAFCLVICVAAYVSLGGYGWAIAALWVLISALNHLNAKKREYQYHRLSENFSEYVRRAEDSTESNASESA